MTAGSRSDPPDQEISKPAVDQPRPVPVRAPLPAEIAFLERHGIARSDLQHAATLAREDGVSADRALLSGGLLSAASFYELLAGHLGVAFLHAPLPIAGHVGIDSAMSIEMAPLAPNAAGLHTVLAPHGPTLAAVMRRFEREPWVGAARVAITTPQRLAALVRRRHHPAIVWEASHGLPDWDPSLSARTGATTSQKAIGFGLGFVIAAGLTIDPWSAADIIGLGFSVLFLAMVTVRLAAAFRSPIHEPADPHRVPGHLLPVYTVVVPLYREARMVHRLVAALSRLDYPRSRLDIKFVLEADDHATLRALDEERLDGRFETLIAPGGEPRTKPRALNVGLRFARGDYLVTYDAEDEPEPGQLREAVAAFERAGPQLACLQARLAIDNARESWLTRLFTLEYAALFDVINPGLARLRLPIALGGTSNHFRIEALRHVNGWDAWNVTEDIDLGIRLARFGFDVGTLASTTFEEAPLGLRAWMGQRQRWQKGWMITLQTHSRDPARLIRDIGPVGALAVFATLCGTVATSLLGPLFTAAVLLDAALGPLLHPRSLGGWASTTLAAVVISSGVGGLIVPMVLGMHRRGVTDLALWLALQPVYLGLMSIASWRALVDLFLRPHAWTKTEHGLAKTRSRPSR